MISDENDSMRPADARPLADEDPVPVRVCLVDDEPAVTDALVWLLDSVRIPATAFNSTSRFLATLPSIAGPACAVIDLRMPEMSGLELQQQLHRDGHDLPLIFLSAHGDVPTAVKAMQEGALDFVLKPFNPDAFLASVRKAIRRARELHEGRMARAAVSRRLSLLSAREREVLGGVLDGRTSKEIARQLAISPKTVDVHRANLVRKMRVDTTAELIRLVGRSLDRLDSPPG